MVDILGVLQLDVVVPRGVVQQVPVVRCLLDRRCAEGVSELVLLLQERKPVEQLGDGGGLAILPWPRD